MSWIFVGITLEAIFPFGILTLLPMLSLLISSRNTLNSFFHTGELTSQYVWEIMGINISDLILFDADPCSCLCSSGFLSKKMASLSFKVALNSWLSFSTNCVTQPSYLLSLNR